MGLYFPNWNFKSFIFICGTFLKSDMKSSEILRCCVFFEMVDTAVFSASLSIHPHVFLLARLSAWPPTLRLAFCRPSAAQTDLFTSVFSCLRSQALLWRRKEGRSSQRRCKSWRRRMAPWRWLVVSTQSRDSVCVCVVLSSFYSGYEIELVSSGLLFPPTNNVISCKFKA